MDSKMSRAIGYAEELIDDLMADSQAHRDAQLLRGEVSRLRAALDAARFVCGERERELLELKGPCSVERCRLHYAHSGPCDIRSPRV